MWSRTKESRGRSLLGQAFVPLQMIKKFLYCFIPGPCHVSTTYVSDIGHRSLAPVLQSSEHVAEDIVVLRNGRGRCYCFYF